MYYILIGILLMITGGCKSQESIIEIQKKKGIIESCYTVLEYAPIDKKERINKYLEKKVYRKEITESEKEIIKECIERTEKSQKWSK